VAQRTVVVSDLEGTLTKGETWRGVAAWLAAHGRGWAYRRFVARRAPALVALRLGRVGRQDFRDAWIAGLCGCFRGLDVADVREMAEWVVDRELWPSRRAGLVTELATVVEGGGRVVLASGTYEPVLAAFARRIGAESAGTPLEMVDGCATGRTSTAVATGERKAAAVRRLLDGVPPDRAFGDSVADVPMLELAREAVAVNPDRELAAVAAQRGWRIVDGTDDARGTGR
jgi:phosphoserine phosphatase